jgi:hypothetical protein
MQTVTTIGLDIAKSVFQVHCVDAARGTHRGTQDHRLCCERKFSDNLPRPWKGTTRWRSERPSNNYCAPIAWSSTVQRRCPVSPAINSST